MNCGAFKCGVCGQVFRYGNRRTVKSRKAWRSYCLERHACKPATAGVCGTCGRDVVLTCVAGVAVKRVPGTTAVHRCAGGKMDDALAQGVLDNKFLQLAREGVPVKSHRLLFRVVRDDDAKERT